MVPERNEMTSRDKLVMLRRAEIVYVWSHASLRKRLEDTNREEDSIKAEQLGLHTQVTDAREERNYLQRKLTDAEDKQCSINVHNVYLQKQLDNVMKERHAKKAELEGRNNTVRSAETRHSPGQNLQDIEGQQHEVRSSSPEPSVAGRDIPASAPNRRLSNHLGDPYEEWHSESAPKRFRWCSPANGSVRRHSSSSLSFGDFHVSTASRRLSSDQEQWIAVDEVRRDNFTYGDIPPAVFDKIR
ncbi:MAG: hypothetical protein LQ341_006642 [Variospora aurantia]|nr:MAG: hypothetical protein LQ341_006642 [Variospora aurantia]